MNLLLIEPSELSGTRVLLRGRRARHIVSVHRAAPGRVLRTGVIDGLMGHATVISCTPEAVELEILLEQQPPQALPIELVLALPRPKVLSRVLFAAASLGIKHIHLINAWRVEKSYWNSPRLTPERLQEDLVLGLEQAEDTGLPLVETHRFFTTFVRGVLAGRARMQPVLVAHPRAEEELTPRPGPVTLVIGPEGGFIEDELSLMRTHGAICGQAGKRILRVETAIPWLCSAILS